MAETVSVWVILREALEIAYLSFEVMHYSHFIFGVGEGIHLLPDIL